MASLYVTSVEEGTGKTTICAGLGRHFLGSGKKVGFLKPVILSGGQPSEETINRDTLFMKHILGLDDPVDSLCPVIRDRSELISRVKEAYSRISYGKDVVIIEGIFDRSLIEALEARVIAVEGYSNQSSGVKFGDSYKDLGKHLLGVVLNKVPASKLGRVHDTAAQLSRTGIGVLGVLPEDRVLFTLTIGELANCVQGEILNSVEQSAELVENFMLGAMFTDPGLEYYSRKGNKAVVVRGNRPDMQLAALETATRCLVLCGNTPPIEAVHYEAEVKKIPIILTKDDIMTTVGRIEDALSKGRFNQEEKLLRLTEIMRQHFNFQTVYQGLGLFG